MADKTDAQLIAQRQARARAVQRQTAPGNPLYGKDMFEPESYVTTQFADPSAAQPLPSGRYVDPTRPTQLAQDRARTIQGFQADPKKYVLENTRYLADQQSLIDKGKTMLSRMFDYRDASDLAILNVNLSPIESVWDGFLRYLTGGFDLLNVGYGGLISAAPGGIRTLSFDELTGGRTVGQVLNGEMMPGDAPSPGQIAIASIARESKRIREGNVRLTDLALLTPTVLPFIMAGIKAETSPLQTDDFDIMNKEQRDKAFGAGWEQWMSGITDAGLMLADPTIGAGVALKVLRAGAMGARSAGRTAEMFKSFSRQSLDDMTTTAFGDARPIDEIFDDVASQVDGIRQQTTIRGGVSRMVAQTQSTPTVQPVTSPYAVFTDMAKPDDLSFLGSLYWDIAAKDRATGLKKMSVDEITRLKEIEALPDKASAASLLHQADDPLQVGLLIETLMGVKDASQRLSKLQAGLADEALRLNMVRISSLNMFEPMKVKEASDSLKAQIDLFREQQLQIRKEMDLISPTGDINALSPEARNSFIDLQRRSANLDNSIDATREVYEFAAYGKVPDKLDPTSAFYRPDQADAILSDILRREDWVTRVTRQDLYEASLMSKMPFMAKNNRYTRVVAGSRRRRGRAAYEYAAEGTGWLPRSIVVGVNNGQPVRETTGWFAKSSFEGTNRFQRNLRVWRWLGAETPSGYIGLKGTATVGSEREFRAATNLDLYRGDGVQIQEKQIVQKEVNGRMFDEIVVLSRTVGGRARRDALYQRFYQALNNPDEDMVSVLGEIEENIMQDLALAYGLDLKGMDEVLKIANRRRDQSLKIVRERGYSVDEDGSVNMIPYLETHLINGTYMQNFMDLERSLSYATRTGNIGAIQRGLQSPLHLANNGYEIFQNFWRPITLLRLNYTQRNVFEGLVRSMAYSASLAPLSWPVRATVNGTRNRIVKSVMKRRVEDVRARVSGTDYGAAVRRYRAADDEIMRLRMAIEVPDANGNLTFVETMRTADGSVTRRTMSEAQYQRRLQTLANERSAAEASMAANKAQFEKAIEGTKFKTWRDSQITALNKQLEESEQWTSVYLEGMQQKMLIDPDFSLADMTVNEINHLATETALAVKINQQLFELEHSPSAAIAAWQSSAGRQRRIGSGTTMGPDGNYYQDAFAGPLEQINRSLMSADNTVKQSLSLRFDAYNSLFQKIVIKENQAVPFTPGTRKQWIQGMIRAIEDDSSSRVVRKLLDTDFNEDAVIAWLKSDDEQAVEFMTRVMPMTNGNANLKQMATSMRDVKGRKVRTIDENALRAYVVETKDKVLTQMQGKTAFLDLLRRRAAQKRNMETSGQLTADDIEAALATLTPDELGGLGAIQGAEIIQMGTDTAMGIYSRAVQGFFHILGTIPEDAAVRGPFYNMRFKAIRNELVRKYWEDTGDVANLRLSQEPLRDSVGGIETMGLRHDKTKIPVEELQRIMNLAHRQALQDTREWLYTIERRTNLGKYGEYIWPFISATQNTVTVAGKLLYKEPWLAPMVANIWNMPNRLGLEDEEGNIRLPIVLPGVTEFARKHPEIPVLGGLMGPGDQLTLNKNGINMWAPDTGFGLIPRPGPLAIVPASELMKLGLFPIETPQPVKTALGDEAGTEFYESFKAYIFGEKRGASEVTGSWDLLMPALLQRIGESKSELSKEYGYQYALQEARAMQRFHAGEIDELPTADDIHKMTTNMFWLSVLGQLGVPTPITPYPTLTRPDIQTPAETLQKQMRLYQEKDPQNAMLNFSNDFGDWALQSAMTEVSKDIGGAAPTPATVSDIKTLDPLLRRLAPVLQASGGNLDVLGMLVNNRNSLIGDEPNPDQLFEASAFAWLKAKNIPGINEQWREIPGPGLSSLERQRITGWSMHRQFMDIQEARLASRGLTSFNVAAAADLKAANDRFIANMKANPEMAGWVLDYEDRDTTRITSAVTTMQAAVNDPTFTEFMIKNGKEQTLACMIDYLKYRGAIMELARRSGSGLTAKSNARLAQTWDTIQFKLKQRDVRWADIANRFFANDNNPQAAINVQNVAGL